MKQYQRKAVEIRAQQWNKHGDVDPEVVTPLPELVHITIQRRFPTERPRLKELGYFMTRDGGVIVAPGDWVVTSAMGVQSIVKQLDFERDYEEIK